MQIRKTKAVYNLIRWYAKGEGNKEKLYKGIQKKTIHLKNQNPERPKVKVYCYYPSKKPLGGYLLTPGLHPLGADHPKIEDFSLMLASLGYIVYNPHMKDYSDLHIVKETLTDYFTVFDAFTKNPRLPAKARKINIFSISFGCIMALRLASNKKRAAQVGAVIIFGGFGSWQSTCDAIMNNIFPKTEKAKSSDIRSVPAIYNHLIEFLPAINEEGKIRIRKAWLSYMQKTWMNDSYISRDKCLELANEMACKFYGQEKTTFLLGLGAHKDCLKVYKKSIHADSYEHLNPLHRTQEIVCSVYLIHGKHDELIPAEQQSIIKEGLPPKVIKRAFLTKLYGHSEKNIKSSAFAKIFSNISEIKNIIRIILTLSVPKTNKLR